MSGHLEDVASIGFEGLAPVVGPAKKGTMKEEIKFHKTKELYLDINPTLSWETTYRGDNGSKMILRSVVQGPETIVVTGGELE